MGRLLRWILKGAAGVSLVVCVAAGVMWWRSERTVDPVTYSRPAPPPGTSVEWHVRSEDGLLKVYRRRVEFVDATGVEKVPKGFPLSRPAGWDWQRGRTPRWTPTDDSVLRKAFEEGGGFFVLRFGYMKRSSTKRFAWFPMPPPPVPVIRTTEWTVFVPWYAIVTITAIGPGVAGVVAWQRRRRRRRVKAGLCGACGYDLRESPQRCPECGAEKAR